jgi:glycosyltransferase involved in cell wall biosynthesis
LSIKASALADDFGYEVHILSLNAGGDNLFYPFSSKIKLHSIPVFGNPINYIKLYVDGMKRIVDEVQPDIISVCDDGLKAFFLPKILGKPCAMIYERHVSKIIAVGMNPSFFRKIAVAAQFKLMNILGRDYDKFVVLTNDNIAEWNLHNIAVIPNPLSFNPERSSTLENKRVIAVGRQSYQKGYDRLLKSWQIVNQRFPDWELHIYGKYNAAEQLPAMAAELKIEQTVRFFEPVKNIEDKYLDASIFVLSSRFEGFGMVLTEAMACGVPCVSYDCPCGPADIISDGVDGYLVPNGDVNDFAQKVTTMIADTALRVDMGRKAKRNVKRFQADKIIVQWDNLFKSLLR